MDPIDLLDLDQALQRFSQEFPEKARLVELKFFGGLTLSECAIELGICERTADRYWHFARAWLNQMLFATSGVPVSRIPRRPSR